MSLPTSPVPLFLCEHSRLLALLSSCVSDRNETRLVLRVAWLASSLKPSPGKFLGKLSQTVLMIRN